MKQPTLNSFASISVGLALLGAVAGAATPITTNGTIPSIEPVEIQGNSAQDGRSNTETLSRTCWIPSEGEMFRVDETVLAEAEKAGSAGRFVVDREAQLAYLLIDGRIAIETRVCTGRRGKETPLGSYRISQKVRKGKRSSIYGCKLPYWMRLTDGGIGLHIGEIRDNPASAGCIRLPAGVAPLIYDRMPRGSEVSVLKSLGRDQSLALR